MKSLDTIANSFNVDQMRTDFTDLSQVSIQLAKNQRLFDRSIVEFSGGPRSVPFRVARYIAPAVGVKYDMPEPGVLVGNQKRLLNTFIGQLDRIVGVSRRDLVQVRGKLDYTAEMLCDQIEQSDIIGESLMEADIRDDYTLEGIRKIRALNDKTLTYSGLLFKIKLNFDTVRQLFGFEQQLSGSIFNAERLQDLGRQYLTTISEMSQAYLRMGLDHQNLNNVSKAMHSARDLADTIATRTSSSMLELHKSVESLSQPRDVIDRLSGEYGHQLSGSMRDLSEYVQTVVKPYMGKFRKKKLDDQVNPGDNTGST